jgi:Tfp pilus assembly protein PilF
MLKQYRKLLLVIVLLSTSNIFAEEINSKVEMVKPSSKDIRTTKRALIWCTNNLAKIINNNMYKNQVKSAKENYFSKREGLENLKGIFGYVPQERSEQLYVSGGEKYKNMFDNKSYGEIISTCDREMMAAYLNYFDNFKPTNLAEKKIATYPKKEDRENLLKEQSIGKQAGLDGVTYGLIDTMVSILNNEYTTDSVKGYLIKPSVNDQYWVLTNVKKEAVAYEMWYKSTPLMIIVMKNNKREYIDMGKLPKNTYYQMLGIQKALVSYQGTTRETSLFTFKEYDGKVSKNTKSVTQSSTNMSHQESSFDCRTQADKILDLCNNENFRGIKKLEKKFMKNCHDDYDYNTYILLSGVYFHNIKNLNKAAKYAKKALKINDEYTRAYLNLSGILMEQGRFDASVELCDKQLKRNLSKEDRFMFNANAGLALFKKADEQRGKRKKTTLAEAKVYFEDALEVNENAGMVEYYLGFIYRGLGETQKSKDYFSNACSNGIAKACKYKHAEN